MGNPHKGEVSFDALSKTWTLRYGINEICVLEEALNLGIAAIAAMLSDVSTLRMGAFRTIFRAGLYGEHPELSEEQAGEIIHALGFQDALKHFNAAFALAFPSEGKAADARPPNRAERRKAAAGTGKRS